MAEFSDILKDRNLLNNVRGKRPGAPQPPPITTKRAKEDILSQAFNQAIGSAYEKPTLEDISPAKAPENAASLRPNTPLDYDDDPQLFEAVGSPPKLDLIRELEEAKTAEAKKIIAEHHHVAPEDVIFCSDASVNTIPPSTEEKATATTGVRTKDASTLTVDPTPQEIVNLQAKSTKNAGTSTSAKSTKNAGTSTSADGRYFLGSYSAEHMARGEFSVCGGTRKLGEITYIQKCEIYEDEDARGVGSIVCKEWVAGYRPSRNAPGFEGAGSGLIVDYTPENKPQPFKMKVAMW